MMALPKFYLIQEGLLFHFQRPHSTLTGYSELTLGEGLRRIYLGASGSLKTVCTARGWRCWEPARRGLGSRG